MSEPEKFYHTFRYHQTEAPGGRRFTDRAAFDALSAEWVDTPAKFAAVAELPTVFADLVVAPEIDPPIIPKRKKEKA